MYVSLPFQIISSAQKEEQNERRKRNKNAQFPILSILVELTMLRTERSAICLEDLLDGMID